MADEIELATAVLRALKHRIERKGDLLNLTEFGQEIGLSRDRVSKILRGQDCRLGTMKGVAERVGMPLSELIKLGEDWLTDD